MVYREIKQALIDTDRMFRLLEQNARSGQCRCVTLAAGSASIRFEHVDFSYDRSARFCSTCPRRARGQQGRGGGALGGGQSTLARLLYRFLRRQPRRHRHQRQRHPCVRQASLRGAIGIVRRPLLFNDTITTTSSMAGRGGARGVIERRGGAHPRFRRKPAGQI